jgi:hypothetical protein
MELEEPSSFIQQQFVQIALSNAAQSQRIAHLCHKI